jgi:hypothetical protein
MSLISDLAVELRGSHGGTAGQWQQAVDACGSEERVRWLIENPPGGLERAPAEWTPDHLIVAHAAARLLEDGPGGMQSVYATT